MKSKYAAVRGTRDILPDDVDRWRFVESTARAIFARYGFREIRTPVLESLELFARAVGEATDIVHKEMFTIERGGETLALRPENTASLVRAFVEHNLDRTLAEGYPARFYYIGPMFRYERPQKGRQRQFHQIGAELLGAAEPLADAETLDMLWRFLDALGVDDRELLVNSLGGAEARSAYRQALVEWLSPRVANLCADCRRRFDVNPLRVLDCKVPGDAEMLADAPSVLDHLDTPSREHFERVCGFLDRFEIPFRVEPRLVRGLDYYEKTVFEVVATGLGAQNAILGGGRYDGLVKDLGGKRDVPGIGFAIGVERLLELVADDRVERTGPDVAIVCLGDEGWDRAVGLARDLRSRGLAVVMPLASRAMGAQMKRADRMGARFAIFVGKDEIERQRFALKDLSSGEQAEASWTAILDRVSESLGRDGDSK